MKLSLGEKISAYRLFSKAEKLLRRAGGEYVSFFGMGSPLFDGFETIDIVTEKVTAGNLIGSRITIKKDNEKVFEAEKIPGLPFEPFFKSGNWQKVIEDEYARKDA